MDICIECGSIGTITQDQEKLICSECKQHQNYVKRDGGVAWYIKFQ